MREDVVLIDSEGKEHCIPLDVETEKAIKESGKYFFYHGCTHWTHIGVREENILYSVSAVLENQFCKYLDPIIGLDLDIPGYDEYYSVEDIPRLMDGLSGVIETAIHVLWDSFRKPAVSTVVRWYVYNYRRLTGLHTIDFRYVPDSRREQFSKIYREMGM